MKFPNIGERPMKLIFDTDIIPCRSANLLIYCFYRQPSFLVGSLGLRHFVEPNFHQTTTVWGSRNSVQ